jgi:hypothetical protein
MAKKYSFSDKKMQFVACVDCECLCGSDKDKYYSECSRKRISVCGCFSRIEIKPKLPKPGQRKVNELIELLKSAKNEFACVIPDCEGCRGSLNTGLDLLDEALAELEAPPRWETPDQWEKRTGEKWPDNGAVYALVLLLRGELIWEVMSYDTATSAAEYIICATEAGPPPENFKP